MSDDDEIPDFIIGTPEEVQAKVREMMDRQSMAITAMRHDVQRFFTELTTEQLSVLRFLLHQMSQNPEAAPFYEGVASTTMLLKHNVCPGCGVDHDQEARDALSDPDLHSVEQSMKDHPSAVSNVITKDDVMEQYGLIETVSGLRCTSCGKTYVSLEDRTLNKPGPEGCDGCIEKTKWG